VVGLEAGLLNRGAGGHNTARDGTAYYANYAGCSAGCSAQALKNSALNEIFTSDVYVLFSVPSAAQPMQIAYTGANPPFVMAST
jgi:hypothetical protein